MKIGTRVRMTEALRRRLIDNGSREHAEEFDGTVGTVIPKDRAIEHWPEVQVRWDGGLRYLYDPKDLEEVVNDPRIEKLAGGRFGNLSVSQEEFEGVHTAVLLYVPDTEEPGHEHIEMDMEACIRLRDWLNRFIWDHDAVPAMREIMEEEGL